MKNKENFVRISVTIDKETFIMLNSLASRALSTKSQINRIAIRELFNKRAAIYKDLNTLNENDEE